MGSSSSSPLQHLPLDVLSVILQKVAISSCIDLASLSATSPALRGIVNANKSSLYGIINIVPLLNFSRWSDAQFEFLQNCIDCDNTDAQFWFGLWCYRVQGDWNRAKIYLEMAKEKNDYVLYTWTMLSVIHAEELEEDDWENINDFFSCYEKPGLRRSILLSFFARSLVLSLDVVKAGVSVLMMSCEVAEHFSWLGGDPQCIKCVCDQDAQTLFGYL